MVMPYHSADSLAVRLRREGAVPWPETLSIGVKLCGALENRAPAGTLHRDIKPANILVNDYGERQLSDFGIAHIEGGYETATGFFSGTIDYTAPEVIPADQYHRHSGHAPRRDPGRGLLGDREGDVDRPGRTARLG